MQVNETMLQSLVNDPWKSNYVYAKDFEQLRRVEELVEAKTCTEAKD